MESSVERGMEFVSYSSKIIKRILSMDMKDSADSHVEEGLYKRIKVKAEKLLKKLIKYPGNC